LLDRELSKKKLSKKEMSPKKLVIEEEELFKKNLFSKKDEVWKFSKKMVFVLENSKIEENFIS
jgi:hypothetical protein